MQIRTENEARPAPFGRSRVRYGGIILRVSTTSGCSKDQLTLSALDPGATACLIIILVHLVAVDCSPSLSIVRLLQRDLLHVHFLVEFLDGVSGGKSGFKKMDLGWVHGRWESHVDLDVEITGLVVAV